MPGDLPYSSLDGKKIISAASTIQEFMKNDLDWSAIYRRANSYTCKVGGEPGMAYVLMQREELEKLDSRQPLDFKLGIAGKSVTFKKLAFLQAQSLLPLGTQNPGSLYLVTLTDVRHFLKRTTINARYNIRSTCSASAWCDGTIDASTSQPYTFLKILELIWSQFSSFGGFFAFSTWDATKVHGTPNLPTKPPENLRFEGISAWDALEQVCQQCGFFIRYDPLIGDVRIMKIGLASDPAPAADGDYTEGFGGAIKVINSNAAKRQKFPLTPNATARSAKDKLNEDAEVFVGSPLIPAQVVVVFPTNDASCGEFCEIDQNHGWYYSKTVTVARVKTLFDAELADSGNGITADSYAFLDQSISGTSVNLNSTYYARFDAAGDATPNNASDLTTVAEQMAKDYYRTLGYQASGRSVFGGIKEVIPGPTISEVIWREWGDGLKTEFARWPMPVGLPRVPKVFSGGPSAAEYVKFTIDSYDEYTGIATCTITYRPCGVDIVSGETYGKIEVIDPSGCLFDEPAADLIGRWGDAEYMQASSELDPYQSCAWIVSGLCCPT